MDFITLPLLTPPSTDESSNSPNYNYTSPLNECDTQTTYIFNSDQNIVEMSEPFLQILEEPVEKFRFRYRSEMTGTHGSLNGERSVKSREITYPSVKLLNFEGNAIIRCSIYQNDCRNQDMKPHAHRLVKRNSSKQEIEDPHDIQVDSSNNYTAIFRSMGIIHTARKHIVVELIKKKIKLQQEYIARHEDNSRGLTEEEELKIKRDAENESRTINLNVVCLRFEAFTKVNGIYYLICDPVYSRSINNLKSALTGDLKIARMDHCTGQAKGNREIFLLVERVVRKNIKVRFFETDDEDNIIWEDFGKFSDLDVHHQYAIVIKTPPYADQNITTNVKVNIELVRPSDYARSEPREFIYTPNENMFNAVSKRKRFNSRDYDTSSSISNEIIPLPIKDINLKEKEGINSRELEVLAKGVDSSEFNRLYNEIIGDYNDNKPNYFGSNEFDFPEIKVEADGIDSNLCKQMDIDYIEYGQKAQRVYEEIVGLLKTKPSRFKVKQITKYYLCNEDDLNAWHMAVLINETAIINFFLNLVFNLDCVELVNIKSFRFGTLLHLSVLTNKLLLITHLIGRFNADITITNRDLNTPIHLATELDKSGSFLKVLLQSKFKDEAIDMENSSGDTALHIAVKYGNYEAVKLLCSAGANVNIQHKCNGHTALRMAIEKGKLNIISYLLEIKVNHVIQDFKGISPFDAATYFITLPNDVKQVIDEYMSKNNIKPCESIKTEDDIDPITIVSPIMPQNHENINELYENVKDFTKECLNEVAAELDKGKSWKYLCDLLDLNHLLRYQMVDTLKKSPTKIVLASAIKNGESVKQIRDFLDTLDEVKAVESIDRMVLLLNK